MKRETHRCVRNFAFVGAIALTSVWSAAAHAQAAGQWKDAAHVYAKICSNCHENGVGPIIKGRAQGDNVLTPEYYQYVVRNGLKAMPAFRVTDIDTPMLKKLSEYLPVTPMTGGSK